MTEIFENLDRGESVTRMLEEMANPERPTPTVEDVADAACQHIEMHVPKSVEWEKLGRRVKRAGGTYTRCGVYDSKRFVDLQVVGNESLIDEILSAGAWTNSRGKDVLVTAITRGGLPGVDFGTQVLQVQSVRDWRAAVLRKAKQYAGRGMLHHRDLLGRERPVVL